MASHRSDSYVGCVRSSAIAACAIAAVACSSSSASVALHAAGQPAGNPVAAVASGVTLDGPYTHANLAVFIVRGATSDTRTYITLDEGLAARTVAVREQTRAGRDRAEVNTLEIDNQSDTWLFLQAGDIVKGGKQDRTIMTD